MVHLSNIWFVIVGIFWVGFFILEGFDFGVGILHSFVGHDDTGPDLGRLPPTGPTVQSVRAVPSVPRGRRARRGGRWWGKRRTLRSSA